MPADSASHGIHDVAEEAPPGSIVVLGSHKSRGLRRTNPGSTAERLLQGSATPVALVPWDYESAEDHELARVVVAYVDTPDGQAALRQAVSIASRLGASLELVTVVPDTRVIPSMGDIRRFGHEQRAAYAEALDRAIAGLPEGTEGHRPADRRFRGRRACRHHPRRRGSAGLRLAGLRTGPSSAAGRGVFPRAPACPGAGHRGTPRVSAAPVGVV